MLPMQVWDQSRKREVDGSKLPDQGWIGSTHLENRGYAKEPDLVDSRL